MNSLKCLCGNVINTGSIPNENVLYLSSDESHAKFCSHYDENHKFNEAYEKFNEESILVWKCKKCERMYLFNDENDGYSLIVYKLEENVPETW